MALTSAEQYMIELINRARLDPVGEAARLGITLNQGLAAGTISAGARGVVAPESNLEASAIAHSKWMLTNDVFSHVGVNDTSPNDRAMAAGYVGNGVGENISWRGTTGSLNLNALIEQQHADLFRSTTGHRENILHDSYREIGLAQEAGTFAVSGTSYNASMVTQNFASKSDVYYVTGVVYDDTNGDKFYSIGEGVSGAQFSIASRNAITESAGGYGLQTTEGAAVLVTGTVNGKSFSAKIEVDEVNAKLDVVNGNTFYTSADLQLVTGIHNARLLGTAALNLAGNGTANTLEGNSANNILSGGAGNDTIKGMAGKDKLEGGAGADRLYGDSGIDVLRGDAGADRLYGGMGADWLYGGTGNDRMTGGAGSDKFVFTASAGTDLITDFGATDMLRFDADIWGGSVLTAEDVLADQANIVRGDVVIALGSGQSVTLDGVSSLSGLADNIVLF